MKRTVLIAALLVLLVMVVVAPAQAATTSLTFSFAPEEYTYYLVYVDLTAGVPFLANFVCVLQSEYYGTPGSIDPYLELYAPGTNPLEDEYVAWADDEGELDCAGAYDAILEYTPELSGTFTLLVQDISSGGGDGILTLDGVTLPTTLPFPDGRVNQQQWATAAVFCNVNGNLDIYAIDSAGVGRLVIRENWLALQALGVPEVNTLRAQSEDGSVRLYRLSSGEWQVNAPADSLLDGYVFRWTQCVPGGFNAPLPFSGPFDDCICEGEGEGEEMPR